MLHNIGKGKRGINRCFMFQVGKTGSVPRIVSGNE